MVGHLAILHGKRHAVIFNSAYVGHSTLIPVVSILHLRNMVSPFTYEELFKTDRGVNMGQPEATFISFHGLWNEDEVGSGLKDWITSSACPDPITSV